MILPSVANYDSTSLCPGVEPISSKRDGQRSILREGCTGTERLHNVTVGIHTDPLLREETRKICGARRSKRTEPIFWVGDGGEGPEVDISRLFPGYFCFCFLRCHVLKTRAESSQSAIEKMPRHWSPAHVGYLEWNIYSGRGRRSNAMKRRAE